MSFCINSWKYVNEGNVHIVLQILDSEYVLRLIKDDYCKTRKVNVYESVEFVNLVMIPLIFSDERYQEEVVEISSEEIVELTKSLYKFRPKNRTFKSMIRTSAIKAPNLTLVTLNGDNYCIEIKPKEGYLADSLKGYLKCYYCMKQFLKLSENHINCVSSYCPLDLFSGDKDRMKFALKSLIENPQNNFKIFKNGVIIYEENLQKNYFEIVLKELEIFGNSIHLFLDFMTEILLGDGKSDITVLATDKTNCISKSQYCKDGNKLKNNSFLFKLLNLQRLSEKFIYAPDFSPELDYVNSILKEIKTQKLDLRNADHQKIFFEWDSFYLALVSAVVKDCSIMISFTKNINNRYPKVTVGGSMLSYKLGVTDLEPKPAKVLHKRSETEKKLLDIYAKIALTSKYYYMESSLSMDDKKLVAILLPPSHTHYEEVTNLLDWAPATGGQQVLVLIESQHAYIVLFSTQIQPHAETRAKQLEAWQQLITDYLKTTKQSTIDIRESQNSPLFNNATINRKLSQESLLTILEEMAKTGRAAPVDKSKNVWEIYWHSLDEWGNMLYNWANSNGLNNTVCTLYELREGDNTVGEEFHGLDMNVLVKALKALEVKGKCELIEFDDNQGVKFF